MSRGSWSSLNTQGKWWEKDILGSWRYTFVHLHEYSQPRPSMTLLEIFYVLCLTVKAFVNAHMHGTSVWLRFSPTYSFQVKIFEDWIRRSTTIFGINSYSRQKNWRDIMSNFRLMAKYQIERVHVIHVYINNKPYRYVKKKIESTKYLLFLFEIVCIVCTVRNVDVIMFTSIWSNPLLPFWISGDFSFYVALATLMFMSCWFNLSVYAKHLWHWHFSCLF